MEHSNKKAYIKGLETGIPIGLGYFAVSFALGIQAKKFGIGAFQSALMSFGLHASAGQYIFITLFGAGTAVLIMVLMELVANSRYLLMSCSLSQKIPEDTPLWKRLIMGYFITDEIFGAAVAVKGKLNPFYIFGMATVASPGWVVGTALGVIMGDVLSKDIVSALSVGLFGMFIAIIIPEAKKNKIVSVVIVISFVASYIASIIPAFNGKGYDGIKIIILTVIIAGIFAVVKPVKEGQNE